jgi:hypothetical protein
VPASYDENVLGHDAPFAPDSLANARLSVKSRTRARLKAMVKNPSVNTTAKGRLASDAVSGFKLDA